MVQERDKKLGVLEKLQRDIFNGKILAWQPSKRLGPQFEFVETADAWYTHRKSNGVVYAQPKRPEDALATCYGCNSNVVAKNQAVTGWARDGPGPCAGTEVTYRTVMYCPTCEKEPINADVEIVDE